MPEENPKNILATNNYKRGPTAQNNIESHFSDCPETAMEVDRPCLSHGGCITSKGCSEMDPSGMQKKGQTDADLEEDSGEGNGRQKIDLGPSKKAGCQPCWMPKQDRSYVSKTSRGQVSK